MTEETYHSEALRVVREELGISQEEAASGAGTDQSYLSKCERGVVIPSLPVFAGLAAVYGMTVADLASRCFTSRKVEREVA